MKPANEIGSAFLFDIDENREDRLRVKHEALRQHLDEREAAALEGKRYPMLWTDCLKDELRPIAKVKEGKTRTFSIPPKDFVILVRKYFLAFAAHVYSHGGSFGSMIGMNMFGHQYDRWMTRMHEVGENGFAGDFKRWDGSLHPSIMRAFVEIVNRWYNDGDENARVRCVLMEEMIDSYHCAGNLLYRKFQGNPSGTPLTLLLNTIAH